MNRNIRTILPRGIISLLFLWFFLIGGCDVEFGGGGGDNGGGGGGGGDEVETVQGTIVSIIPDQDLQGITVEITVDDGAPETDITDDSGFFSIDGPIAGSPQIEFFDGDSNPLGTIIISIYPTARVELGNISLESGNVNLLNETEVTFNGDISSNNCTGNSGFIEIDAENDQEQVTVIVQISESTDIIVNGNDTTCEDLLLGRNVEIQGDIPSINTVNASRIEVD
ncbi:MAG: hypothetical protein A3J42_05495 [Candidatus Dadabacteria bacterium RIFCSPHIGHO2_12_FULL_53_21]|nr:MAG: hypothetical protein A3J42_05495 [Candidatus Dadabacteria bacterium RIFCSPHIGHO2_12_FULL_53_21]